MDTGFSHPRADPTRGLVLAYLSDVQPGID
jgi:hypothetical protein